jgi:hypothetical protein
MPVTHLTFTRALAAGRYFLAVVQADVREVSWERSVGGSVRSDAAESQARDLNLDRSM